MYSANLFCKNYVLTLCICDWLFLACFPEAWWAFTWKSAWHISYQHAAGTQVIISNICASCYKSIHYHTDHSLGKYIGRSRAGVVNRRHRKLLCISYPSGLPKMNALITYVVIHNGVFIHFFFFMVRLDITIVPLTKYDRSPQKWRVTCLCNDCWNIMATQW